MKKILFLLNFTILCSAQIPQGMSHRGTAYNLNGGVLRDSNIGIRIRILEGSPTGSEQYRETHNVTTNNTGQYNLIIGNGLNPLPLFNQVDWSNGSKFLEIAIDPNSGIGSNYLVVGSSQLMSVPYSLFSEKVKSVKMETVNTIADLRNSTIHLNENLVYVKGYWYAGDGGGGYFSFNSTLSEADNEGTIIKPISVSSNGRWIRQYEGNINVQYFGVIKGWYRPYAAFSNSDQIQKAINYATQYSYDNPHNSMVINFPSGAYYIDKTIYIRDKLNLQGESGTMLTNHDGNYDYMFKLGNGIISDFKLENFSINLNHKENVGGMHLKGLKDINGYGGLWNSRIKNLWIINLNGNGIYLEGGDESSNFQLPNQFLIFEGIRIVRESNNHNSLKITGQFAQATFLNCTFDGIRNNGINVNISKKNINDNYSAGISFINCTFQDSEFGLKLEAVVNVTLDNCWFENLDLAIQIKDSKAVNVVNSHFGNAAGFGDLDGSMFPPETGRCLDIENSSVNIEKNFITVNNPNSANAKNELFILGVGNNNTINLLNNQFDDIRLSNTFGVMQTTTIESNTINTFGKKLIFINNPNTSNQINRINSTIGAGETIFIRANTGGTIVFNAMNPTNANNGRNIHLNGRSSLILQNGQAATFIKIDNIIINQSQPNNINTGENCTYQLYSISN